MEDADYLFARAGDAWCESCRREEASEVFWPSDDSRLCRFHAVAWIAANWAPDLDLTRLGARITENHCSVCRAAHPDPDADVKRVCIRHAITVPPSRRPDARMALLQRVEAALDLLDGYLVMLDPFRSGLRPWGDERDAWADAADVLVGPLPIDALRSPLEGSERSRTGPLPTPTTSEYALELNDGNPIPIRPAPASRRSALTRD
jgi:hypothetical protein